MKRETHVPSPHTTAPSTRKRETDPVHSDPSDRKPQTADAYRREPPSSSSSLSDREERRDEDPDSDRDRLFEVDRERVRDGCDCDRARGDDERLRVVERVPEDRVFTSRPERGFMRGRGGNCTRGCGARRELDRWLPRSFPSSDRARPFDRSPRFRSGRLRG